MCHLEESELPQRLARAGYVVLTFDYRGWGESDGKISATGPLPPDASATTLPVRIVRGVLDSVSWPTDVQHALDYIEGEVGVDVNRIGLWGSSFGGGVVMCVAANDPRVKCVVSQLGAYDMRGSDVAGGGGLPFWTREELRQCALKQARGAEAPFLTVPKSITDAQKLSWPQYVSVSPDVRFHNPMEFASRVKVPTLLIDAGDEPHWDIRQQGEQVFRTIEASGNAAVEYRVIPGVGHDMDTYRFMSGSGNERLLTEYAIEWFDRYLKPLNQSTE
jgi:pimeloyl-ACP methyl ester carboxylesterase